MRSPHVSLEPHRGISRLKFRERIVSGLEKMRGHRWRPVLVSRGAAGREWIDHRGSGSVRRGPRGLRGAFPGGRSSSLGEPTRGDAALVAIGSERRDRLGSGGQPTPRILHRSPTRVITSVVGEELELEPR